MSSYSWNKAPDYKINTAATRKKRVKRTHESITADVEAFLNQGGNVTEIPAGASGKFTDPTAADILDSTPGKGDVFDIPGLRS